MKHQNLISKRNFISGHHMLNVTHNTKSCYSSQVKFIAYVIIIFAQSFSASTRDSNNEREISRNLVQHEAVEAQRTHMT